MNIPLNRPHITGYELAYLTDLISKGDLSSDGEYSKKCVRLLEEKYSFAKILLTPSCTSALEMAATLCELGPGDEVLLPSFTFVSTANAVIRTGATPVFVDIRPDTLNIDENLIESAITDRTKAIFVVHYAGVGCNMDRLTTLSERYHLFLVEDAAQGLNAFVNNQPLGSIGELGAFSFHSTKNYGCGEGGALCINSPAMVQRAEIIREKGTNRNQFLRGTVDKYTWVDIGSSYLPSELVSAYLLAQLEMIKLTTSKRKVVFDHYQHHLTLLQDCGMLRLPYIPAHCKTNYHLYYLLLGEMDVRNRLLRYLNGNGIAAAPHFVPLHTSPMGRKFGYKEGDLPVTESINGRLLRLPIYPDLTEREQMYIIRKVNEFMMGETIQEDISLAYAVGGL